MSKGKPRSVTTLSLDEINKALDAANKEYPITEGKVILLTADKYQKAYEFVAEHFVKDEPIEKALGVQWTNEIQEKWFHAVFKLNLSLVLINPENDEIIAIRTTTISKRGSTIDLDEYKDPPLRELFRVVKVANERANYHEHFDVDEAVHFLGLAVDRKYRDRNIATKMIKFTLKFLDNFSISPLYLKVEGSSKFSQNIFNKLGFQELYDFVYKDHYVDGKQILKDIDAGHVSMKVYGYKVC